MATAFPPAQVLVEKSLNFQPDTIDKIKERTIGQRHNPLWYRMRKNRLTASLFGKAIRAVENNNPNGKKNVVQMVTGEKTVPEVPATRWGIDHEKDAIEAYMRRTGLIVKDTGLWVFPNGFLAASPDGIVFDPWGLEEEPVGIIEVKCPYYARDHTFAELHEMKRWPHYLDEEGNLKDNSDYYHQVQGELHATCMPFCDFVVWTARDFLITRVYPSDTWRQFYFPKLVDFYIEFILTQQLELLTLDGMFFYYIIRRPSLIL